MEAGGEGDVSSPMQVRGAAWCLVHLREGYAIEGMSHLMSFFALGWC